MTATLRRLLMISNDTAKTRWASIKRLTIYNRVNKRRDGKVPKRTHVCTTAKRIALRAGIASPIQRLKTSVKPFCLCFDHLLGRFWKMLYKAACAPRQAEVTDVSGKRERYRPGEPEKRVRAGTTVFGGMIVLSAILAQSLMMENFP
jgi:hypothetical protein